MCNAERTSLVGSKHEWLFTMPVVLPATQARRIRHDRSSEVRREAKQVTCIFSDDRRHRYVLRRDFMFGKGIVNFLMLRF